MIMTLETIISSKFVCFFRLAGLTHVISKWANGISTCISHLLAIFALQVIFALLSINFKWHYHVYIFEKWKNKNKIRASSKSHLLFWLFQQHRPSFWLALFIFSVLLRNRTQVHGYIFECWYSLHSFRTV